MYFGDVVGCYYEDKFTLQCACTHFCCAVSQFRVVRVLFESPLLQLFINLGPMYLLKWKTCEPHGPFACSAVSLCADTPSGSGSSPDVPDRPGRRSDACLRFYETPRSLLPLRPTPPRRLQTSHPTDGGACVRMSNLRNLFIFCRRENT